MQKLDPQNVTVGLRGLARYGSVPAHRMERTRIAIWFAWTLGLTVFFARAAGPNLANFRPVSNDDIWVMSASYKLATQHVLGSDLYTGFFHADQHYFLNLPVHHVLQAISFSLFGIGVAQARWVSLTAGLLLIWIVGWLAYRWYGLLAALLAGLLLVFWRSDLIGGYLGLPLVEVARSGRYDLGAVTWAWLSVALLDRMLRRPRPITALAFGLCSGLAMLTQFFGAFVFPLVAAGWLRRCGRQVLTRTSVYCVLAGVVLIGAPYVFYATRYSGDAVGQAMLKGDRIQFDRPMFYLDNIRREPDRFAHLLRWPAPTLIGPDKFDRPFGPWLLIIGIWPALLFLGYQVRQGTATGDCLLGLSLVSFVGLLALLDQTKAPLYAVPLLPAACLAFAGLWAWVLRWVWNADPRLPGHFAAGGLIIGLLLIVVVEGVRAYRVDLRQSSEASDYLDIGRQIDAYLTPGAPVFGAERWWWALHDHPYLASGNVWVQWRVAAQANEVGPEFADWIARARVEYVVVNDDVRDGVRAYPQLLQMQFSNFLSECSARTVEWTDATYGRIEVYRLLETSPGSPACRP